MSCSSVRPFSQHLLGPEGEGWKTPLIYLSSYLRWTVSLSGPQAPLTQHLPNWAVTFLFGFIALWSTPVKTWELFSHFPRPPSHLLPSVTDSKI